MKITPEIGGLCQSKSGRDKDRFYIIEKVLDNDYLLICDGNYKKLSTPKKKNVKHLHICPQKFEAIAEKLKNGKQVYDSEVYSALKVYNSGKDRENI